MRTRACPNLRHCILHTNLFYIPTRHPGQPNPIDIQKALSSVHYPTTREKLVEQTRRNHASTDILDIVSRLPDRKYDGPAAVEKEIAHMQ
jgi:hypothetical protein